MNRVMALPRLLLLLGLCVVGGAWGREVTVEASGTALAEHPLKAREMALTDALREAVRKGVGTRVTSVAKVRDFALDYDLVFARTFGFVRDYEILEAAPGDDGMYRVKIRATVSDSDDFTSDREVLRMLVRRRGAPRVAIQTEVRIDGIEQAPPMAAVLREMALDYQLQVVDLETVDRVNARRRDKDKLAERPDLGHQLRADYDFLIRAEITGGYAGRQPVFDTEMHSFGLSVDLTAVWADTGETVASLSLPAVTVTSSVDPPAAAARDCIVRLLEGKIAATQGKGADMVFRRSLVKWMAELDLGRRVLVDVERVDRAAFEALQVGLKQLPGVDTVYEREFDAGLLSRVELETRLPPSQLLAGLQNELPGYRVETATAGHLRLRPAAVSPPPVPTRATNGTRTDAAALPGWFWLLLGVGVAGLLIGTGMLLRRTSEKSRTS